MKRFIGTFCAILLFSLPGCTLTGALPRARELENTSMLRVLGIDVSTRMLSGLAVTAAAEPIEEDTTPVFAASAATLAAAVSSLQSQGTGEVTLAYVGQVVLGEGAAQRSITETLDFALEEGTIGLDATVWIVRGITAADVVKQTPGLIDRLTAMETGGGRADLPLPRSVRQTASSLAEYGSTLIPALSWKDGTLQPAGYAVIRDGALLGYADGAGARGVELLLEKADGQVVEVETPGGASAALKISSVTTKAIPAVEHGVLAGLSVVCAVRASIAQLQGTAQREELRLLLEQEEQARIRHTLELAQGLQVDFLNLEADALLWSPWNQNTVRAQWAKAFPELPITVTVCVDLLDTQQNAW